MTESADIKPRAYLEINSTAIKSPTWPQRQSIQSHTPSAPRPLMRTSTSDESAERKNSRVSESKAERDDVSIKVADVVFHCAFREVADVKVSPSAAGISPQATACLRSIKCKGKQLICLTGPDKGTVSGHGSRGAKCKVWLEPKQETSWSISSGDCLSD